MKWIERLSTIAVLVMAVTVIATFWRSGFQLGRSAPNPMQTEKALKGQKIEAAEGLDAQGRPTVVIGVSSQCAYCSKNIEVYRKLCRLNGAALRVVVTMPQPEPESSAYAKTQGLQPERLFSGALSKFHIEATPTILLLDKTGTVNGAWIGVLNETREKELFAAIGQSCDSCITAGANQS